MGLCLLKLFHKHKSYCNYMNMTNEMKTFEILKFYMTFYEKLSNWQVIKVTPFSAVHLKNVPKIHAVTPLVFPNIIIMNDCKDVQEMTSGGYVCSWGLQTFCKSASISCGSNVNVMLLWDILNSYELFTILWTLMNQQLQFKPLTFIIVIIIRFI